MTKCTRDHYKECSCLYNEYVETTQKEIRIANEIFEKVEQDLLNGDAWKEHIRYITNGWKGLLLNLKTELKIKKISWF